MPDHTLEYHTFSSQMENFHYEMCALLKLQGILLRKHMFNCIFSATILEKATYMLSLNL